MHWLIQSSGIRRLDDEIHYLLDSLTAAGVTWSDFGHIPGTTELTNWEHLLTLPPGEKFFVHTSIEALRILRNTGILAEQIFQGCDSADAHMLREVLKDSLFYHDFKFDQAYYGPIKEISSYMLNRDADISTVADVLDKKFEVDTFVKPSNDLKLFKGFLLPPGITLREKIASGITDGRYNTTGLIDDVIVAPAIYNIQAEYRCFVVDKKIVAQSQYMSRGHINHKPEVPDFVLRRAEQYTELYQPARAFVMDVAIVGEQIKIVEYNCINCSGLYRANVKALATALKEMK